MARNFRRYRGSHPIADLNVTNLIDLGFMLLVIFMVATPLMQQEQAVGVNLPSVAKSAQPKSTPDERHVAVGVDARGYYVDRPGTSLSRCSAFHRRAPSRRTMASVEVTASGTIATSAAKPTCR